MNITFNTTAESGILVLDAVMDREDMEVSQHIGRRASDIAWTVHHYLKMLRCLSYIGHIGISFRIKSFKPTKYNIVFNITINWEIFDAKKAEISLEVDEEKQKIFFKELRFDKNRKNEPLEEPPVKEIDAIWQKDILCVGLAKGIIQAIKLTIRDISDDAKDRAKRLHFRCDELARISKF